jgi:transposase
MRPDRVLDQEGLPTAVTVIAHSHPFVIGVDTHARNHVLAIVAATGQHVDTADFPTTKAGMARAIAWMARRTGGDLAALWVIECTATYGAQLAQAVTEAGYQILEAPRMNARDHRGVGKSDPLDARRIAEAALALEEDQLRHPRHGDGERAALRVLVAARDHMTRERTAAVNALTALTRAVDLGIDARRPLSSKQIAEISHWRTRDEPVATTTARAETVRLARRIVALDEELSANQKTMDTLVRSTPAAGLLDKIGIGPVTAAICLTVWSHHGRVRSEAAFACLAGVNPIPASSGNTIRHRLNRGGDRRLNRALHMATITRMIHDPATREYAERRRAQGRTTKRDPTLPEALTRQTDLPAPQRSQHLTTPCLTQHRRVHRPHTATNKLPPITRLTNLPGQYKPSAHAPWSSLTMTKMLGRSTDMANVSLHVGVVSATAPRRPSAGLHRRAR